jgi:hypothetical protein
MDQNSVRALVDLRDRTLQKLRISFGNRLAAIENGNDSGESKELFERWFERFNMLETEADKDIELLIGDEPIVEILCGIKGIGTTLSAKLISMIDIQEADSVSALWRYAGYAVIDGEREKPTKGEPLHYNARLKTTCYLIGSSFLKCSSPYRAIYDSAKEYYEANRPDWPKGHKHNAAMRKMIKIFLSHLWESWRELEGLPIKDAYVLEKLGHTHRFEKGDFGWKKVK